MDFSVDESAAGIQVVLVGPACNDNLILLNDLHSRLCPESKEPEVRYNKDLNCKELFYPEAGWRVLIPTSWRNLIPSKLSDQAVIVYTCNPKFQDDKSFSMKAKILARCDVILEDFEQMYARPWVHRLPVIVVLGSQPRASFLGAFKGVEFSNKAEFLMLFENQFKMRSAKTVQFVSCDSTSKLNLKFEVITALRKYELNKFYIDDPYLSLTVDADDAFVDTLTNSNAESGSSSEFDLVPRSRADSGLRPTSSKSGLSSGVLPIPEGSSITPKVEVRPLRSISLPSEASETDKDLAVGKPRRSSSLAEEEQKFLNARSTTTISLSPFEEKVVPKGDVFKARDSYYSRSDDGSSVASSPVITGSEARSGSMFVSGSEAKTGSIVVDEKSERKDGEELPAIKEDVAPETCKKLDDSPNDDEKTLVEEGSIVDPDPERVVEEIVQDDCSIGVSTASGNPSKEVDCAKSADSAPSVHESKIETVPFHAEEDYSTVDEAASISVSCAYTEKTLKADFKTADEESFTASKIFRRRRSLEKNEPSDGPEISEKIDHDDVSVSDESVQTFEVEDVEGAVASVRYVEASPPVKIQRRSRRGSPQAEGCTPPRRFSLEAASQIVSVFSREGLGPCNVSGDALTDLSF